MENQKEQRDLMLTLVNKVMDVHEQGIHYAHLDLSNYGRDLSILVRKGGFDAEGDFYIQEDFKRDTLVGSERFLRVLDSLDRLLEEGAEDRDD